MTKDEYNTKVLDIVKKSLEVKPLPDPRMLVKALEKIYDHATASTMKGDPLRQYHGNKRMRDIRKIAKEALAQVKEEYK